MARDNSHDLAAFLRALHRPGDVFEVRAPNCPAKRGASFTATASGYFNDPDAAADAIARLDEHHQPPGVYVTINPTRPDLIARAVNRIELKAKTTTADVDTMQRRWLLLDLDAVRPAGVSSTDAELAATLEAAAAIRDTLAGDGWPAPLEGMSGNGAYLLYRISLANDDDATDQIRRALQGIAARFNSNAVTIDTSVFNAGRIAKALGTVARKGDDLRGVAGVDDRPHRRSWFIEPAGELQPVSRELLEAIAAKPEAKAERPKASAAPPRGMAPVEGGGNVDRIGRCIAYLERCPEAISGRGGHKATLRAAAECYRFNLSDGEAWNIMQWFNDHRTGGERWSDAELSHKLKDARAKVEAAGEVGTHLNGDAPQADGSLCDDAPVEQSKGDRSERVARIGRAMFGKRSSLQLVNVTLHGHEGGALVLHLADGRRVPIGTVAEALRQGGARSSIIDATGENLRLFKLNHWNELVAALRRVAEVVEADSPSEELTDWLTSFARRKAPGVRFDLDRTAHRQALLLRITPDQAEAGSQDADAVAFAASRDNEPYSAAYLADGRLLVRLDNLAGWIIEQKRTPMTRALLSRHLSIAGWRPEQVSARVPGRGRVVKARMWLSPCPLIRDFSDSEVAGDTGTRGQVEKTSDFSSHSAGDMPGTGGDKP